ncbi:ECF-type sigma factor negative effector [Sporosarcina sp. NCCP-2716]|uniref:DUF4179 domain-containing protein n=1 Tax=Sporosarcina sp. NCCP-2716 TaxID=2943679 RepID=UPI00203D8DC5|nr:DUF4179 domain-containing protein [Sporosarcina sp. NCCP-2716]GKV69744.1 ECF-type sigma factor negative effector [Sporosarcina sp. NCCP-2716]
MKSLYKRLNEMKSDEDIEPMDVSPEERKAMKQRVRRQINRQRRVPKVWRHTAAAAVIAFASLATLGFGFPTLASQIPLVSNIFSIFNEDHDGFYTAYENFATDVSEAQTSNGITITVDQAIYDGKTVTLTYSVETEKELGQNSGVNSLLDVDHATGAGGTSAALQEVGDGKYVGMLTTTPNFNSPQDVIQVSWKPESVDNYDTLKELKGDWKFDFKLHAIKGAAQNVNQSTEGNGIKVSIDSIQYTDISTVIEYSQVVDPFLLKQWDWVTAQLLIKDDLDNEYMPNGNSGFSDHGQNYQWNTTVKNIDKQASVLKITPQLTLDNEKTGMHKTLSLDPVEIKLQK